ncbi:N2-acetyl-L-aminoadipate kinase /N-acetylglutamate kinase [Haloarcula quadrata]|uniref:Putative [LysW]-aminoadipate/[LysW]-glutamate kinase n=4 Tax=Haloarcula TaxID=2237 RepID=Q5UZ51_HALMA|nr:MULTISPECIES: acetylglutamate/acetylaminoadipate kinase [Haloarcula]AAV47452.1 acetylglutamate kinase [Haloarcula marismortui ATCC 43049]EMA14508.1 acetylglutamate/acetylaminoadipate kinase [Haloarcula sinaiiensis ATCC 33800]KAA9405721.1 acetylglutamate/acetylaminoadipate kinase [Haloarcula sp. CBA1131]MCJ0620370.1 acetylglutamate/acetylaminoadipate kinase [Haloarcula hispanica]NHN65969.1 acetylglutamate/acetylaminoadipate kinase [Haloarcula sp. JP-Z28]
MTVVIKVGGARAVDPAGALADVASLVADGEQVVVVHGGSTKVDETLERLGVEPEYVETPSGVVGRFTDETTMEVFEMAFGHLNTQLVAGLQSEGVDAVGLTGVDGKLLYGPRKSAVRVVEDGKKKIRRGDHSGTIKQVNGDLLETLLGDGYTPVAGPPMAGDDDGEVIPVNTDADRSAAAIAGELDAQLVLLTDVEGVYADPDDPSTLIESVETASDWDALEDAAEGFMGRKIMAAEEALDGGASEVVVADANAESPILSALDGGGTHVHASALEQDTDQTATEEQ